MEKISIVVTTYNHEEYSKEALDTKKFSFEINRVKKEK